MKALLKLGAVVACVVGCASSDSRTSAASGGGEPDAARTDTGGVDAGAALGSVGCDRNNGDPVYPAGTTVGELVHDGSTRTFRVHVPPFNGAVSPRPVVLMFHGGGGSGRQFEEASARMNPIADREGFIAVYADGTGALKTWNGGGCCGYAVTNGVDDVGFVAALLGHLEGLLCVDRRRVFASGMSNGAILSHRLACELEDRIAAIAPVAGTNMAPACTPARPVPMLQIHGTADGHVPWDGGAGCGPAGVSFTSVSATLEGWQSRNGCGAATSSYLDEGDGHCTAYEGCRERADVVLCSIEGGGHNWPGGEPPAGLISCPGNGFQSQTFQASEVIWRFFSAHPMPAR